jgi:hypothetical protein
MPVDAKAFLERWHQIVAARDVEALGEVLADDVTMGAPPYWQKFADKKLVLHLLGIILHTIEDFTYHREWLDGAELALEFTGHVEGLELQGIDLISLDDAGKVRNLDVVIRPLNAVTALRDRVAPQMAEYLSSTRAD